MTYEDYLAAQPAERRADIDAVWQVIRRHIPDGYTEHIDAKFLTYKAGDDWYLSLGNQKNYISLYLCPVYMFPEMDAKLTASGKKLKRGKSCINFSRADDLPLDVIGEIVAAFAPDRYQAEVRCIRDESRVSRQK